MKNLEALEKSLASALQRPQRIYIEGKLIPNLVYATLMSNNFMNLTSVSVKEDFYTYEMTNGKIKAVVSGDWWDGDFTISS